MANTTQNSQLIIGSPYTNTGSWNVDLVFPGAGATARVLVADPGFVKIGPQDTYTVTAVPTPVNNTGYSIGDTLAIDDIDYAANVAYAEATVDVAAAGAGTITVAATNVLTSTNYFFAGDTQTETATTRNVYVQSGFTYTQGGIPPYVLLNSLPALGSIMLMPYAATGGSPYTVTIKVNDIYSMNTTTGVQTRGQVLDLRLVEPAAAIDPQQVATLQAGDVFTVNYISPVVDDITGGSYNCDLVIENNSGSTLLLDLEVAIIQ
jgi:hypothetical protein